MVRLIILINIVVYLAWSYYGTDEDGFMAQNFLISWSALAEGRYWTLISSVFSHNMLMHILINMYVFFGFGSIMETVLGSWRFLRFYLFAGILSSLLHATVSAFLMQDPGIQALGASGAICGVVAVFALMFPREKILLLGIIPIPAIFGALLAVGLDLWGLSAQTHGGGLPIGHGAHLGGTIAGVLYYFLVLRRPRRPKRSFAAGRFGPGN